MTTTEIRIKMAELKLGIDEKVKIYNETLQNSSAAEAAKIEADLNDQIAEYGGLARKLCFMELKVFDDPMMEAVKRLRYTVIGTKDEKISDERGSLKKRTTVDKERDISLVELDKHCDGIGRDKKWYYAIQALNKQLTIRACEMLGVDPRKVDDSYIMADLANQIELGANPVSDENMLASLQKIIDMMIGSEYRVDRKDVGYLLSIYHKKSKTALHVACSDHKKFALDLAQVCHHLVTGEPYGVEFKQKKQK